MLLAVIGWWLAGVIERGTRRVLMSSPHMDLTVGTFLSSLARYATLVVVFVIILQVVGVQATSLVAVIGAASLAIGLALQGTLSHMAAGVMLLIFRPFRIGDSIEVAGKSGTVQNLNLFMTELANGDNVQVLIPNGQVWGAAMTNFSTNGTRRICLSVPVMPDKDMETISSRLRTYLKEDKRVLDSPSPSVTASNLTDKGVEFMVQAWTKTEEADAVRSDFVSHLLSAVQTATNTASVKQRL
jgi:small conductance mechanosensitive channel